MEDLRETDVGTECGLFDIEKISDEGIIQPILFYLMRVLISQLCLFPGQTL